MARESTGLLSFELKRLSSRRILLFLVFVLIIFLLSAFDGKDGYSTHLEDRAAFRQAEIEKVKGYKLFSQYGGFGFDILLMPSPFAALYERGGLLISNVNASEILKIFKYFKGRGALYGGSGNLDFFGLMLLWSIFALIYGYEGIKRKDYVYFLTVYGKKSFWRYMGFRFFAVSLINTIFLLVVSVFMLFLGLNLFNIYLLSYFLVLLLLTAFFLCIGVIAGFAGSKQAAMVYIFLVISTSLFIIPWGNSKMDELNGRKIENLFKFELDNQRIYLKAENNLLEKFGTIKSTDIITDEIIKELKMHLDAEFKRIFDRNTRYKDQISDVLLSRQNRSVFFPVLFYSGVTSELSGNGGLGFNDFFEYCLEKKKDFVLFYILNRYYAKGKPNIKSFIKGDENIFTSSPRLPSNFGQGVFFTLVWIVGLLFVGNRYHLKKISGISSATHFVDTDDLNPAFTRCRDEQLRNEISRFYDRLPNACSLDKFNTEDFKFSGISPRGLFLHLCGLSGVNPEAARKNLVVLGIENIDEMGFGKEKTDFYRETVLKIYAAVKMSMDVETVVLSDFVKKESVEFERTIFKLLKHLIESGKQIIYLSTDMLKSNSHIADKVKIDYAVSYPIDLNRATLR